jgi:FkbM family methyltransferase
MMKQLIKSFMERTPYRIVRHYGANRFHAIESCLELMRARGFAPRIVVDGGAHVGSFSVATQAIFPDAIFHCVEPQPACREPLRTLCAEKGFFFHECALAETPGRIDLAATAEPSTGVHVASGGEDAVSVTAETLDALFGAIKREDRALLKLDLQGYELQALKGGTEFLRSAEAILTEVSFYAQAYEPPIAALVSFLDDNGFQLYDIASLAGRARDNRPRQGDFVFVREGSELLNDARWD